MASQSSLGFPQSYWDAFKTGFSSKVTGKVCASAGGSSSCGRAECMTQITIKKSDDVSVSSLCSQADLVSIEFNDCDSFPDLTPLRDLEMLTEISLVECHKIEDLSFLEPLVNLEKLVINGCKSLVDVSAIQQLDKLHSLELENLYGQQDFVIPNTLANLRSVSLMGCSSQVLFVLLGKTRSLESLSVSGFNSFMHNVKSVEFLSELSTLSSLYLESFTSVTDFAPLAKLKNLETLTIIDGVNVKNLGFLSKHTKLTILKLHNFRLIDDITPITELKNLTDLSFTGSQRLRNVIMLWKLSKLERLNLSECRSLSNLGPLELLTNLTSLRIKSCGLGVDSERIRRKLLHVKKIELDVFSPAAKKAYISKIRRSEGKDLSYEELEVESFNTDSLDEIVYFENDSKRVRFEQFKSSLERFKLEEFEKIIESEIDDIEYHPFNINISSPFFDVPEYRKFNTKFIKLSDDRSDWHKKIFVCFNCGFTGKYFFRQPARAWIALGSSTVVDQDRYRYIEELELSSKEQVRTLIIDGFMSSVETRYFWCAKLIAWIDENCHTFETDIENTILELMDLYLLDGIGFDEYDSTYFTRYFIQAIAMLVDATGKKLSFETIRIMEDLSNDYFKSYTQPSRVELEVYAEKFKWEIVKGQLNDIYGDKVVDANERTFSNSNDAGKKPTVFQGERFLQIADVQATRASDRALRAVYILIDIAGGASEQTIANSLNISIGEVHKSISNMAPANAQVYTQKLLALKTVDQPQCKTWIANIFKELDIQ